MSATLPGWIVWLLSRRLSEPWREVVIGDLAEEYAARFQATPAGARRWVCWQAIRCVAAPPPCRLPAALPSLPQEKHPMLQTLAADVRYAVRALRRTPGFALAVIGVLASVVGAYYYLLIIKIMYFDEPARPFEPMPYQLKAVLAVSGLFNLLFFVYPGPLVEAANAAAKSLF